MAKSGLEKAFEDYDPEKDPTGAIGRKLAELKLQKHGYPSAMPKPLKEVLKYTPAEIKNHPSVNSLAKTDLSNLKKAGYEVNMDYFNGQDNTGKWNYYMKVLGDNGYFK
jgi:hypothetical protein